MMYKSASDSSSAPALATLGTAAGAGLLFLLLLGSLCVASFVGETLQGIAGMGRTTLLLTAVVQNVVAFCVPAYLLARLTMPRPLHWLGIRSSVRWYSLAAMAAVFVIGLPCLNQVIYWNANLTLPASMHGMEEALKMMENTAADMTAVMLSGKSVADLVVEILVIGVLTGISEELFFRGALQRVLGRGMGIHAAVWVSAFIFSLVHFQFFGFIPRLMLGAFFGYLFAASGSIWLAAAAHCLNNTIVVVTGWIALRYGIDPQLEEWGVMTDGFPWPALLSLAMVVVFACLFWKKLFCNTTSNKSLNGC